MADDKNLVFSLMTPAPEKNQEQVERDFLDIAARGGAEVKEVIKGAKEWTFRAEFTDPKLFVQFARAFPGSKDAFLQEVQRHEKRVTKERMASRDPDTILIAVLFDRKQRVAEVLFHTDEDVATTRGREIDAPVIFFVGAKHVGGIDVDIWVDAVVISPEYGLPSKEIRARMQRVALRAVIDQGKQRGDAVMARAAKA